MNLITFSIMFKEGTIIEGPFWPEPVEIKRVSERSIGIHIIGSTIYSNTHIDQIINEDDLQKIKIRDFLLTFSSNSEEVFLALEGLRYHYASLFDPFLAMNVSKIDPLPFQIDAVYGYVLKLPKIRFLIADDPGAGKTIMAGLIIKELKLRGVINRILIVVPGHLKDQWRRELKEKFQETFTVATRQLIDAHYGENIWERENQIITSMDFAKQDDILASLSNVHWDLIIVDEAHKMAAYSYTGEVKKTDRYQLGEVLSRDTKHFLFLTATPHKGDPENYRLLLDLLEPGFFATAEMVKESIENRENPLFIRRLKEDLKDFDGKPIFTNRYAKTVKFRLSEKEKILYNALSEYVLTQYNLAIQNIARRNVAFALLILQRRLASSTYALYCSLNRRKKRLEELLKEPEIKPQNPFITQEEIEEYEDADERTRTEKEAQYESLTTARNKEELKREIDTIQCLIELSLEVINTESEVKLTELKKAIEEGFKKIEEIGGNRKILIFTESKDTMEYLYGKIKSWGYSVNYIHGGMSLDERIEAEKIFKNQTEVMVATEAAGEGINLQFCHIMINYDIPWNPNRLEQRMGRIHRYGQQKDVFMFNLVAEDTREGEVFAKLFDKLEEIRQALGKDRVFDIIGDIFYGKNLYQLIIDAVTSARTIDEIIREIDITIDSAAMAKIREALGESLATRHIDYTRIREMAQKAREYRLIPEYVEEFFKKAFDKAGGKFRIRRDGFISVESIPYEIKSIAEDANFKNKFGSLLNSYPRVTFDKETAFRNPEVEFISFGHPLFEALLEWVKIKFTESMHKGSVFEDPEGRLNGLIYFFEGEIKDGTGSTAGKKLIALYHDGKDIRSLNPAIIWDLKPCQSPIPNTLPTNPESQIPLLQDYAYMEVEKYKSEILKERERQAQIKKKYGITSLEYLIRELDYDLVELYERADRGEKVDIVIKNKSERKRYYERAIENLKNTIERETHLSVTMPRLLGAIYVKPSQDAMVSDEEIERIGMEIAMNYERLQGREPEDVSRENLGFDIRSKGTDGVRYIEVKARAKTGDIALTPNEWFKAKRFKEQYWLYVVENAATSEPMLYLINNPAENLQITEKVETVRFIIREEDWKFKGTRV
ncbi:helicase-related protein [Thermodesulfovibrio yellowstonii]|uniref:Helicase n=1 Tax=Thermodesulfovibrio yellowstonii TaxID=28262 RepID=A0A9W6GGZ2_9BACT|nr:helicase-related protein [Thermodesulfovibrio islandicus]GLI53729.1 helicase [Thermodesulfovibrio islandicus]